MPDTNGTQNGTDANGAVVPKEPTLSDVMERISSIDERFSDYDTRLAAFERPAEPEPKQEPANDFNGDELEKSAPAFASYMKAKEKSIIKSVMQDIDSRDYNHKLETAKEKLREHPKFNVELARKMGEVIKEDDLKKLSPLKAIKYAYREVTGENFDDRADSRKLKDKLGDGVKGGNADKGKPSIFERIQNSNGNITPDMESELDQAMQDGSIHKEIVGKYGQTF